MINKIRLQDHPSGSMGATGGFDEKFGIQGVFTATLRDADGNILMQDTFPNTVVTVGINLSLDTILAGSSYTVVGPYMGLISSASYSAISASDTMSSHSGWLEAGNAHAPTYSGNRATCAWSAASAGAKSLSAGLVFTFTGSGTVEGAFLVFGSGAVNTIDNTSGTLFSAGTLSGGAQPVISPNTLTMSYTLTG